MKKITLGVLAGLLVLLLFFCYQVAQPFLRPIMLAVVMAITFHPIYRRIADRLGYSTWAALLTTLLALVVTVVPLVFLALFVTPELRDFYATLSSRSAEQGGWIPYLTQLIEPPSQWISRYISLPTITEESVRQFVITRVREVSEYALQQSGTLIGGITSFLIGTVIVFFLVFFLFRDGNRFVAAITEVTPMAHTYTNRFIHVVNETIIANVYAVFMVALVQGALIVVGFLLVGIRAPMLWGFAAAACSTIPFVGTPVVWGPAVVILAINGAYWKAAFLAVWGLVIVGFSDNLIRLIVVSGRQRRHPVLVFLAIVGGLKAFGVFGLLLGPIVVSLTIAVASALHEELQNTYGSAANE
jgi:predicted PurR-regulated permease PerM